MVEMNVKTRGLDENAPLCILVRTCTQGLESVNTVVLCFNCTMYCAKNFTAVAMARASILHGNHKAWFCCTFALKKPARSGVFDSFVM